VPRKRSGTFPSGGTAFSVRPVPGRPDDADVAAYHKACSYSRSQAQAGNTPSDFSRPACPLRLFYSYSHKDEVLRSQLEVHLKLLKRNGVILSWHDRLIGAGQEWKEQISKNLEQADIVLLLISADFLASDYCYDIEMTRALERHEAGEAQVIPVIVRDVDWSDAPFRKLQSLPINGRAVKRWPDRDAAWRNVTEGIRMAAMELQKAKP
jgi:internalin A